MAILQSGKGMHMNNKLVTTKEMFQKAYRGHYAIGAFNVNHMELIQAVVGTAASCWAAKARTSRR